MNQNQFLVVQWWHTKRDYNLGILLLSRFCKNKILANSISKKSEKFGRAKLEYELPKSVQLNHLDMPDYNAADGPVDEEDSEFVNLLSTPSIKRKEDVSSFPTVIKRLKHEYSEMYNARSMVHKALLKVPEVNNPLNNEKRAGFLEEMKTLSARMELFHMHISAWETEKTIPDEEIFWPGEVKKKDSPVIMDEKSLVKQRELLRINNYRDNNRLLYSSKNKGDTPKPLPIGPRRNEILKNIDSRLKEMAKLDLLLQKIRNKNADNSR